MWRFLRGKVPASVSRVVFGVGFFCCVGCIPGIWKELSDVQTVHIFLWFLLRMLLHPSDGGLLLLLSALNWESIEFSSFLYQNPKGLNMKNKRWKRTNEHHIKTIITKIHGLFVLMNYENSCWSFYDSPKCHSPPLSTNAWCIVTFGIWETLKILKAKSNLFIAFCL